MGQYVEKDKFNEMDEDHYKESFEHFDDFCGGEKRIYNRIKENFEKKLKELKTIESIDLYVKEKIEAEKKEPILEEMKKVFQELKENFNENHKNNEDEEKKSFLVDIDKNKENKLGERQKEKENNTEDKGQQRYVSPRNMWKKRFFWVLMCQNKVNTHVVLLFSMLLLLSYKKVLAK